MCARSCALGWWLLRELNKSVCCVCMCVSKPAGLRATVAGAVVVVRDAVWVATWRRQPTFPHPRLHQSHLEKFVPSSQLETHVDSSHSQLPSRFLISGGARTQFHRCFVTGFDWLHWASDLSPFRAQPADFIPCAAVSPFTAEWNQIFSEVIIVRGHRVFRPPVKPNWCCSNQDSLLLRDEV